MPDLPSLLVIADPTIVAEAKNANELLRVAMNKTLATIARLRVVSAELELDSEEQMEKQEAVVLASQIESIDLAASKDMGAALPDELAMD